MDISKLTYPSSPVTVLSIYGKIPSPGAGYEFTGEFRPPITGDTFLHSNSEFKVDARMVYSADEPRLILRKAQTKVVTFRQIDTRLPLRGEWYLDGSVFYKAGSDHMLGYDQPREIYSRTETQE